MTKWALSQGCKDSSISANQSMYFRVLDPDVSMGWEGEKIQLYIFTNGYVLICSFIYHVQYVHSLVLFQTLFFSSFKNHHCNFKSSCKKQIVKSIVIFSSWSSPHPIYFLNSLILFWSFPSSQSRYYFIQGKHTKNF